MKAALLLCILATTALAAPRNRPTKLDPALSEHVRLAEQAWTLAETEREVAKQATRWEDAAAAFALVDGDPVDDKVKREAARAGMLAWHNALNLDSTGLRAQPKHVTDPAPQPVPAREQRLIAALDRYVHYTPDPADPELPGVLYLKARTYAQFDQLEAAIPIYRSLIEHYPNNEVAEYAANLLLDAYNRLRQYDKLIAVADELAANKALLQDRDDLAGIVKRVQRQGKRQQAEQLETLAHKSGELEMFVAAGNAYLAIYNADPDSGENDEVLYNAGVTYEQGRAIAAAINAYGLMQKYFPNSRLTSKALVRLGRVYGDIAMYDKAAEKLEAYAKRYAGEKDASDAMIDAISYRKAIGDRAKALEDTTYFVRTFGGKKPREAADAMWSLTTLYDPKDELVIANLRDYIRTFGSKGGAERLVVAHAKIGLLLWKQACRVSGIDGLCMTANDQARTCGKGTTRTFVAVERDARKVKDAVVELGEAMKQYERQPAAADAAALFYYAQAKLAIADLELEGYLTLAFPTNLDFAPSQREASLRRFREWLDAKQKAAATATRKYDGVLTIKDAAASITAVERTAIIAQSFANTLVTGEIPRSGGQPDTTAAYCAAMIRVAEPLEARSIEAFGVCLGKSTALGWFGDSSTYCERELIRLAPNVYPAARELRGQPNNAALVIASEPPL